MQSRLPYCDASPAIRNVPLASTHAIRCRVYARLALEVAVNWLYTHDGALRQPFEKTLAARIYEATFRNVAGNAPVTCYD
jgi:type I restriction enzyme, R subunit